MKNKSFPAFQISHHHFIIILTTKKLRFRSNYTMNPNNDPNNNPNWSYQPWTLLWNWSSRTKSRRATWPVHPTFEISKWSSTKGPAFSFSSSTSHDASGILCHVPLECFRGSSCSVSTTRGGSSTVSIDLPSIRTTPSASSRDPW